MVTRKQLVSHWREGLAQSEAEADGASPQRSWVKQIYARIYRFLLAVYGEARWRSGGAGGESLLADDDEIAERPSGKDLVDLRDNGEGAPPKEISQIRKTLKAVHDAGPDVSSGPYANGLRNDEWIVVASKRDGAAIKPCFSALWKGGIPCRRRRLGRDTVILVRCKDVVDALTLLDNLGDKVRVSRKKLAQRQSKMRLLGIGAAFGAGLGAVISANAQRLSSGDMESVSPTNILISAGFGLLAGALLGWLVGYHPWRS